uniref:MATH domain-containing protein n=1 Tax=Meloidogyne floridensis TaxID=298350 RepID=A0A915NTV6_9BILA
MEVDSITDVLTATSNGDEDPSWNCSSNVKLKLLSQKPEKEDYVREFSHVFNAKTDDWGYKQFMNFEDIMNPEKGWYDEKKDTIVLLVDVKADLPHGIKSLQGIKEKEKEIQINNSVINLELENLKKNKEESNKKLNEKLKENKEIYEKVAKNVNQMTISCEEIIKLKEENENFMKELDKNNFIIKKLENEQMKNFNEYDEGIELENQSKGLQQLKNIFGSMDGI